ncbi:hypothetical protein OEZ85_010915 [Tetradesmus obliquus]|uniref:non-specific serine/threonine protein kinase n=1 Tax=Tetradesmus obliquus TaxID=3088 RepID=A0ABY8TPE4_TETOB|nr:hypothetical protein OEZ85_010915 [Tetradesmus obliquus]
MAHESEHQSNQQQASRKDGTVPIVTGGLADYDVEQAIGKGGYAVVYKGRRKSDGQVVAIKRVEIADMPPKKRERCIKEVHLLQQLSHPNIITMFDAFVDGDQLVIITEWAPGGDLKRLIRRMGEAGRSFDEPEIWLYFSQILDGLRGMHASRILHRDIKPANVLVCAAGVLKLGDLGLGRKMGPQTVDVASKVGTPYYCSPEVVKGVKYDFKSDMWSMGCLLYELAMLKSPFEMEGANLFDVFQKIGRGDFQPLPADRFSPAMRGAVQQLLAQDPNTRPSAEQCYQQPLAAFGSSKGSAALPGVLQEERAQQQQMGVAVAVCAWLARLANKLDAAQLLEAELKAPRSADGNSSSSSLRRLPLCKDCLRAAEVARRAAQSTGRQGVDAVPAAQLAQGHGRAVCWLLQGMADIVWGQLQLACKQPGSRTAQEEAPCEEELQQDNAEDEADIAATAAALAAAAADSSQDLDEAGFAGMIGGQLQERPHGSPGRQAQPAAAGHTAVIKTRVDPLAWKAEAERLAPQLARIYLPPGQAAAAAAGLDQEWLARWQATRQLQQQLATLVQQLQGGAALPGVQQRAAADMQRLVQVEQRINQEMDEPLGQFSQARQQLEAVVQQRQGLEDAVQAAQQQLHQISSRMEDVQQQIAERTDQLQGSVLLQRQRSAVGSLRDELQQMELRLGLLSHQLVKCKQQQADRQRQRDQQSKDRAAAVG